MSHSQFHSMLLLILRHAWLNLWDKHMTTGRINQVTIIQQIHFTSINAPQGNIKIQWMKRLICMEPQGLPRRSKFFSWETPLIKRPRATNIQEQARATIMSVETAKKASLTTYSQIFPYLPCLIKFLLGLNQTRKLQATMTHKIHKDKSRWQSHWSEFLLGKPLSQGSFYPSQPRLVKT